MHAVLVQHFSMRSIVSHHHGRPSTWRSMHVLQLKTGCSNQGHGQHESAAAESCSKVSVIRSSSMTLAQDSGLNDSKDDSPKGGLLYDLHAHV